MALPQNKANRLDVGHLKKKKISQNAINLCTKQGIKYQEEAFDIWIYFVCSSYIPSIKQPF